MHIYIYISRVCSLYHRFTLDTFFDIAFGFSLNALDNPRDSYLQGLRALMRFDMRHLPLIMILSGTALVSVPIEQMRQLFREVRVQAFLCSVLCAELNKLWIAIAKLFRLQNVMKDYLSAITNRLNDVIEARRHMRSEEVLYTAHNCTRTSGDCIEFDTQHFFRSASNCITEQKLDVYGNSVFAEASRHSAAVARC